MATVFARLMVPAPEGGVVDHGVHAFLVPIRDEQHRLMPGVDIKDCGYKVGYWVFFHNNMQQHFLHKCSAVYMHQHTSITHLPTISGGPQWHRQWCPSVHPRPCPPGQPTGSFRLS